MKMKTPGIQSFEAFPFPNIKLSPMKLSEQSNFTKKYFKECNSEFEGPWQAPLSLYTQAFLTVSG